MRNVPDELFSLDGAARTADFSRNFAQRLRFRVFACAASPPHHPDPTFAGYAGAFFRSDVAVEMRNIALVAELSGLHYLGVDVRAIMPGRSRQCGREKVL